MWVQAPMEKTKQSFTLALAVDTPWGLLTSRKLAKKPHPPTFRQKKWVRWLQKCLSWAHSSLGSNQTLGGQ